MRGSSPHCVTGPANNLIELLEPGAGAIAEKESGSDQTTSPAPASRTGAPRVVRLEQVSDTMFLNCVNPSDAAKASGMSATYQRKGYTA